jgi:hypothetical protein
MYFHYLCGSLQQSREDQLTEMLRSRDAEIALLKRKEGNVNPLPV